MDVELPYEDRAQAARLLADWLSDYQHRAELIVLGLPRGGVPIGATLASSLGCGLDLMLVRKLGVPGQEELAMGAIATGGGRVVNEEVVRGLHVDKPVLERTIEREQHELQRRERTYRGGKPPPELTGRSVILTDDGLATGATMRAAVHAVRQQNPRQILIAVPVAPPDTIQSLREEADEVICPAQPTPFMGIGRWYNDFRQVDDEQVRKILTHAWREPSRHSA